MATTGHAKWTGDLKSGEGKVPGISEDDFKEHAETAKRECPVSKALAGPEITLEATLAS